MFLLLAASAFAQDEWASSKKVVFVERTTTINAPIELVRDTASDLTGWKDWTAWNQVVDPECTWEYVDVDGVVGDEMSWEGPVLKSGRQVLTGYSDSELTFDTYFNGGEDPSNGRFVFEEVDGGATQVTWQFRMEAGFFMRLFRGSMEKALGTDFEVGLAGLKATTEKEAAEAAAKAEAEAAKKAAEEAAAKAAEEAAAAEKAALEAAEGAEEAE